MVRAVLVGHSPGDWRLYRQPQWMAEVRRDPASALLIKHYFDLEETAYRAALDRWTVSGAATGLDHALVLLGELGAREIRRP